MAWMKSLQHSTFIASLWLRSLGFAFVPATKAREWNTFISPLDSEERSISLSRCLLNFVLLGCLFATMVAVAGRAKSLRTCVDFVLHLVFLLEGGCGISGGDETV
eukprot:1291613-Ditylum_brightwellii.AAC.1